jgi:hypothetical protein
MGHDDASLGKASLWCSIIGVALPVCLAILTLVGVSYLAPQSRLGPPPSAMEAAGWAFALSGILFVLLELIAFGCGLAARRTATGKAGLVISGVLLPLVVGLIAFLLVRAKWSG